jgi:hypothetical protein
MLKRGRAVARSVSVREMSDAELAGSDQFQDFLQPIFAAIDLLQCGTWLESAS